MVKVIQAKSILNKTKRRDPWFLDDYTLNPYSGCAFNCLYCYIRGSKYGMNMEEKLAVKENAPALLEKQLRLRAGKGQYGIIVLSSATDPYLQVERTQQLTRRLLEVILKYRFPVHIITKSDLVTRDFDLLAEIDRTAILPADLRDQLSHGACITFSFSTLDDEIAHIFEPGAPAPSVRLEALKQAVNRGFHTGVNLMPLLPFITDTGEQQEHMYQTFQAIGIKYIFPATLMLFGEDTADSKQLVFRAVQKHYPHLLEKYQRFFHHGSEMLAYYKQAFAAKSKALCKKYQLPNTLLGV